jgi:glyoxylase-like metal-dependent hydrolase (beta-lactamase superfamily II)
MGKRTGAAIVVLALLGGYVAWQQRDNVELSYREQISRMAGSRAAREMRSVVADNNSRGLAAAELITLPIEVTEVVPGIWRASGVANTFVLATTEGLVIFDTGLVIQAGEQKQRLLQAAGNQPIAKVILSHSHADHVGGAKLWLSDTTELISHEAFPEAQRYLTELNPYLHRRNRLLFPWIPEKPGSIPGLDFRGLMPDVLVDNDRPYSFTLGGREFAVIAAPGAEGADNLVLWLPKERVLLSGDFFGPQFPQFPNLFTMRGEKARHAIDYVTSIKRLRDLEAEVLLPSHLDAIRGAEQIEAGMAKIQRAVQSVHDQTVAGMNAGASLAQLMDTVSLPEDAVLSQSHGKVSWAVKTIWEYYTTWFHFDRTSELYATPLEAVLPELAPAIDLNMALEQIDGHVAAQDYEKALLLLELLGGVFGNTEELAPRWQQVLSALRQGAVETTANDYEIYWLDAQLAKPGHSASSGP